jgi:hypothetical protein
VWSTNQPKYKNAERKEYRYFGDKVKILCTKEKNYSGADKLKKSTFQKKKQVTKQSYSHTPDAVVVPWTLTRTYKWEPPNQTACLNGSSIDSFNLELLSKLDFNG